MTDMNLNEMAINIDNLEQVNGGETVKCYIKMTTTGKATLRSTGSQKGTKIAMLTGGTKVLGSNKLVKDGSSVYTYRLCYVPSIGKSGYIADSLLM